MRKPRPIHIRPVSGMYSGSENEKRKRVISPSDFLLLLSIIFHIPFSNEQTEGEV